MSPGNPNGRPAAGRDRKSSPEAERLFQVLAGELEEGSGDPESLFAAHPELEAELRGLYRGWLEVDALLRGLASDESLVGAARRDLSLDSATEREEEALTRLATASFEQRYALGEELGHGGMGLVRRVTDRTLGRELAMKVIRPVETGRSRRLLRRFLEEAEVIGRLEHPGIVPIHELGLDPDGQVYFTMPLVRGRTLKEILKLATAGEEGWTEVRVLEVLLRVCDAVAYAHSRGVLHRDLKPANVMVGRFGEVYVMDWGLARTLGRREERAEMDAAEADGPALTLAGEILGTPAYMAPEQALGRSNELDERSDVYALGAILYELLAGVRPYGERSSAEALERLAQAPPAPVEDLVAGASAELVAITRRAMTRERDARYPSVAALASDVRAYLEGRVVRAHRSGPWIEARKWIGRNRGLATGVLAAVLALAAGLVVALVLLRSTERERANVFRLAQTRTLASLIERADRLWPPHPEWIEAMRAWQDDARALVAALEPDEARRDPGLRAQLLGLEERRASWSEEDRWWYDELAKLIAGIEELADPERGLVGEGLSAHGFGVGRRLAAAERVRKESARAGVEERWNEVRASVRDDPRFGGLDLARQVGLIPLGKDPASGLCEFAHVLSGDVPMRDAAGKLQIEAGSALVLVLLPPGEFLMGSQIDDPSAPNFTTKLVKQEYPVHRRSLGAFFLAKHEMTQAQWERCTGANPSVFASDPAAARLPVETLPWTQAHRDLARAGLRLPSEGEWEYGCRAGTTGPYFWGEEMMDVRHFGNVKNQPKETWPHWTSTETVESPRSPEERRVEEYLLANDGFPFWDGYAGPAPVGSFLPNPFGLHDTIGNVHEWCEDVMALYPGASGTAYEAQLPPREMRVIRGGAYNRTSVRSAERGYESPSFTYQNIGVRPARNLEHVE